MTLSQSYSISTADENSYTNVLRLARALERYDDRGPSTASTPTAQTGPSPAFAPAPPQAVHAGPIAQLVYYSSGVGTEPNLSSWTGGLTGAGLVTKVEEAYSFVCMNWAPGDEVSTGERLRPVERPGGSGARAGGCGKDRAEAEPTTMGSERNISGQRKTYSADDTIFRSFCLDSRAVRTRRGWWRALSTRSASSTRRVATRRAQSGPSKKIPVFAFLHLTYHELLGLQVGQEEFPILFLALQNRGKHVNDAAVQAATGETLAPYRAAKDIQAANSPGRFLVKCVGVFDTVESIGLPQELRRRLPSKIGTFGFSNTDLGRHVQHGFQALALNEKRDDFKPILWTQTDDARASGQTVKQVWFAGSHSDIGGGWTDHDLADITLAWMVSETMHMVKFDERYIEVRLFNAE